MDVLKTQTIHNSSPRKHESSPYLSTPRVSMKPKHRRRGSQSPFTTTPIASPNRTQITPPRQRRRYNSRRDQFEAASVDRFIGRRWTTLERNGFTVPSPEHENEPNSTNIHREGYRQMLKHELLFDHQMEPELDIIDNDDAQNTENGLCIHYHGELDLSPLRRLKTQKYFDFNKGASPISDNDRLRVTPCSSPINDFNATKIRRKLQFEFDRCTEFQSESRTESLSRSQSISNQNALNRLLSATPIAVDTQWKIKNLRSRTKSKSNSEMTSTVNTGDQPFRVLDAPNIVDDFYSSIMDWNARRNMIGIALTDNLYLFQPETAKIVHLIDAQNEYRNRRNVPVITAVKMGPSGDAVAVGNDNGTVTVWDIYKERQVQHIVTKQSGKRHLGVLEWSEHWNCILTASKVDGTVHIIDQRTSPHSVSKMQIPTKSVSIKWSPDSTKFAIGGRDRCISIYDVRSMKSRVFKLVFHSSSIRAISWSPHNHNVLVSGGGALDKKLCLWNLNAVRSYKAERSYLDLDCITIRRPVKCLRAESQICNVLWNPARSEQVVTTHGFDSNDINLWDLERGQIVNSMYGHRRRVLFTAMAPNQRDIATASSDERLKFWNVFGRKKDENLSEGMDCQGRTQVIR